MTKKEWTIIGVLGAAVIVVLLCLGILVFGRMGGQPAPTSTMIAQPAPTTLPLQSIRTAVPPTSVPPATNTPRATDTPLPTFTPTNTPKPTNTPLPTSTPTNTPKPPPTLSIPADKLTYPSVDVHDLKKSPEKYRWQKIVLRGEVFKIEEVDTATAMQIWVSYPGASMFDRIAVAVVYKGSLPGLYEKQTVVVYGIGAGTFEGTNAYGGPVSQPIIVAEYVDYGKNIK